MSNVETENGEFADIKGSDMRKPSGLTRRVQTPSDDGVKDDYDPENNMPTSPSSSTRSPGKTGHSKVFVESIDWILGLGPTVFTLAVIITMFWSFRAGKALHFNGSFTHFMWFWITSILMISAIAGWMHTNKV